MDKIFPEERELARNEFDKVKEQSVDTISLFDAVTVFRNLGIETDSDSLYKDVKQWDINFDKFCELYAKKKEEKEQKELKDILSDSFNALGGKGHQEGIIDVQMLQDTFKFFHFDLDVEDFLSHGGFDINSNIIFDDYCNIFGIPAN